MSVITAGRFRRSENETEKGRCIRLLALEQLQELAASETVKVVIADDLRLSPGSLFPSSLDEAGAYDQRKDAIIAEVKKSLALKAGDLRATLVVIGVCLVLGAAALVVLYRTWN